MKNLNIAFWEGRGVSYYRCTQPLIELAQRGHNIYKMPDITDTQNVNYQANINICNAVLSNSDILFMSNVASFPMFEMVRKYMELNKRECEIAKTQGKTAKRLYLVLDYDDDIFNVDPTNQSYKWWGRREVALEINGEKVVEYNKTSGFDVVKNNIQCRSIIALMSVADLLIVTTERLKFKFRRYCGNIAVCPNGIDFDLFKPEWVQPKDDKVRIGWTVSASHFKDWANIRKSIGNVLKRNPNTILTILGNKFGTGRDIPLSQLEYVEWADNQAKYVYNLTMASIDIGICPLVNDRFNWKKSPLKWEEFGALCVPCVVSEVLYSDYVKDGLNAVVYKDLQEFEDRLQMLIDNKSLRMDIGFEAYKTVKKDYDIKTVVDKYEKEFSKLVNPVITEVIR